MLAASPAAARVPAPPLAEGLQGPAQQADCLGRRQPGQRTELPALGDAQTPALALEADLHGEAVGLGVSLRQLLQPDQPHRPRGPALHPLDGYAQRIAEHMTGGDASRFILWVEQGFYSATYRASPVLPNGAGPQRVGWHCDFSRWSLGFADGHADNAYYDTRLSYGADGTIWQPNFRP